MEVEKYDGQFKVGLYHGFGTFQWSDEERYDGEYVNGLQHGLALRSFEMEQST